MWGNWVLGFKTTSQEKHHEKYIARATLVIVSVSSSLIKTTVPTGATTGEVEITTPHGTLKSNVAFRVVDLP